MLARALARAVASVRVGSRGVSVDWLWVRSFAGNGSAGACREVGIVKDGGCVLNTRVLVGAVIGCVFSATTVRFSAGNGLLDVVSSFLNGLKVKKRIEIIFYFFKNKPFYAEN